MKIVLILALGLNLNSLHAGTIFGAAANGNWNNTTTWTPSGTPGALDDAYIGSNTPAGALATATVTLTQNQSANNVNLGFNNSGGQGTLDMNGHTLTVTDTIDLGFSPGGTATILNRGPLIAGTLAVGNQTFNLNAADTVNGYFLNNATGTLNSSISGLLAENSSQATTTAAGNVTGQVLLYTGSTLNMGANMTLVGSMYVQNNSIVNMNGYAISANLISLVSTNGAPTLQNRGALTAANLYVANLYVANQTFNLNATDTVTNNYNLINVTTTLGANMTLSGTMDLSGNSTLNMNGHTITANTINLGYFDGTQTTLLNQGTFAVTNLNVGNQTLNLNAADAVHNYNLTNATSTLNTSVLQLYMANSSTATTTAAGSVTGGVQVFTSSTLNMGANMTLSDTMDVRGNSTLNMNGHTLTANTIKLGYVDGTQTTVLNQGTLAVTNLYVRNQTLNLNAGDSVTNFYLNNVTTTLNSSVYDLALQNGSRATITTAGNVTWGVALAGGSILTVGANMTLSGPMQVDQNSILDMAGHSLTASDIELGFFYGSPASIINNLGIQALNLYLASGSDMTVHSDDVLNALLYMSGHSTLKVLQANGQLTGLTLNGNAAGDLSILDTSRLILDFGSQTQPNWIFRWADPTGGGNWDAALANLITGGRIVISAPNGYSILDQSGYTYIQGGVVAPPSTPEPASAALVGLGLVAILILKRRAQAAASQPNRPEPSGTLSP